MLQSKNKKGVPQLPDARFRAAYLAIYCGIVYHIFLLICGIFEHLT